MSRDAMKPADAPSEQPDDDASSDGDRSWTADPITADPDEDRSVDAVIARTSGKSDAAQPGHDED